MLQVTTLDNLVALLDGVPVAPLTNTKPLALWLYLALEGRSSRGSLATLFWGELGETAARGNLRFALNRLRQQLPDYIEADRNEVWVPPDVAWSVDIADLALDLDDTAAPAAVGALLGLRVEQFLIGTSLRNAPGFEDWLTARRRQLADQYFTSLDRLARRLRDAGSTELLVDVHRRCLSLEPWSEAHHEALIATYLELGQVAAATAQYDTCCQLLERELGAAPGAALAELGRRLAQAGAAPSPVPLTPALAEAPPFTGQPHVPRKVEEARLIELLRSAVARVVSIVGPGGVGKTHLARAVTHALAPHFASGACFIELAGLEVGAARAVRERLVDLIAERLGCPLAPGDEPGSLLAYLAQREVLLVLDNFEQWSDAVGFITGLTHRAPRVRVLLTSRHRTGLATEWCVPLAGLPLPAPGTTPVDALRQPACDLFLQHARRRVPDLDVVRDAQLIVDICRAVEGYPLAIILAAHWMPTLSCAEILRRLSAGFALLNEHSSAPMPARHRSIGAVLEESWQLLDDEERDAFMANSLFRGGFTAEAAIGITGCTLATLDRLGAKSLLREGQGGRLEIHPLLRELGALKLADDPQREARLRRAQTAWFHGRLEDSRRDLATSDDSASFAALRMERDNLVSVFEWLLTQADIPALTDYLEGLWTLHRLHGWFDEGASLLAQALALTGLPREVIARWQLWLSDACFQAERHADCRAAALASLAAQGERTPEHGAVRLQMGMALMKVLLGARRDRTDLTQAAVDDIARGYNRLAQVYFYEGDRPRFVASTLASISYAHAAELAPLLASGALVLGYTPFKQRAARYAERAERALPHADSFERAWAHEQLCLYYLSRGDITPARQHGLAGRELCRRLHQYKNWGECTALVANAWLMQGQLAPARALMQELQHEARRARIPANEMWGLAAEVFIDLRVSDAVPAQAFDRARSLIERVVDPNTHLLYYGILAWWHMRRGELGQVLEALRIFHWVNDRASMLSIYVLNGFIAATLAALIAMEQDSRHTGLAALCESTLERFDRLSGMVPAAQPYARLLRGRWLIASGRHARGAALIQRTLANFPPDTDVDGLTSGLLAPGNAPPNLRS